ncbi:MAG TPA: cobalamin-binding protein [Candidatus Syntrophoarchaeum butanivorans]|uniref:Cobalamin-binding protein n=1 Tax=Candidatus Syntropharchaeum butanivorans TaxID=1839936 RepID=A0A1F2P4S3_9EURY|nr:MAG: corrinoid methyltransferase [Candidatus Syntrophoarchaeum butanivorans]HEC57127.1 cobalamin-binding protein [Candidatus Syntrophoarchaeum butanivorans]
MGELEEIYSKMVDGIVTGDEDGIRELTQRALELGATPNEILKNGLTVGMTKISEIYDRRECALPELVLAGEAFYAGLEILTPVIASSGEKTETLGTVVCGVVLYDVHDIGMTLVRTMLEANGFKCYDLGKDVPPSEFIKRAKEVDADIIAASALMTTTMPMQQRIIEELKKEGIRDRFKVMVGGAPVSRDWMEHIGADGYGVDAVEAVQEAKKLMGVV